MIYYYFKYYKEQIKYTNFKIRRMSHQLTFQKMFSKKKCEKKLREIQLLKQNKNKNHSADELDKINKEIYYKQFLKQNYEKKLAVLPDDIQIYIMSFIDTNTRLNCLRSKYTPDFVDNKLSLLPNDNLTIKRLYSCIKYTKKILTTYLNKDGGNYKKIGYYIEDCEYYPKDLSYFMEEKKQDIRYNKKLLILIIITCVKHYTKMYNQIDNNNEICENEKNMIKLFTRLSLL